MISLEPTLRAVATSPDDDAGKRASAAATPYLDVQARCMDGHARFWDKGEVERAGHGTSIVRHTAALWEIEGSTEILGESPLRFQNIYRIEARGLFLAAGVVVSSWSMELIRKA